MASRAWGTCSRELQASCMHITGYNAHHPDCTWSIGIFIHTYLFSCKLCGSRAGFKWDFERHRSGRLQCSFQHARTSMLRCLICRFDKLHHTVIVCIQADFKLWVEILAVRPSSCCVPSLLLWVRSSSRSTSRTTMWWASASNSWAYFSGLSELWVKEILNLNKVVGAATLLRAGFPPHSRATGLWGKLSDQTEFTNHGSSPAQQNDSPDAHFLCGPEKCCMSLLPAHFGVFRYLLPAGFAGHFARTQVRSVA